jgi:hypothetical protein
MDLVDVPSLKIRNLTPFKTVGVHSILIEGNGLKVPVKILHFKILKA